MTDSYIFNNKNNIPFCKLTLSDVGRVTMGDISEKHILQYKYNSMDSGWSNCDEGAEGLGYADSVIYRVLAKPYTLEDALKDIVDYCGLADGMRIESILNKLAASMGDK